MSLLWTVLAESEVFAGYGVTETQPQVIEDHGVMMLVTPLGDGTGRLERLFSPRPADYLRPQWQPGTRVRMPMSE